MTTEPGGWELKRSIDQLRVDSREDTADLKADVAGVSAKLDNLDQRFTTKEEHRALSGRVAKVEKAAEKRTDRSLTIWLAIGLATFSSLVSIALAIVNVLVR